MAQMEFEFTQESPPIARWSDRGAAAYQCPWCDNGFASYRELVVHQDAEHDDEIAPYRDNMTHELDAFELHNRRLGLPWDGSCKCCWCGEEFSHHRDCLAHEREVHPEKDGLLVATGDGPSFKEEMETASMQVNPGEMGEYYPAVIPSRGLFH